MQPDLSGLSPALGLGFRVLTSALIIFMDLGSRSGVGGWGVGGRGEGWLPVWLCVATRWSPWAVSPQIALQAEPAGGTLWQEV